MALSSIAVIMSPTWRPAADAGLFGPYSIAVLHAGLGEDSQALDWLERGLQDRSLRPLWLKLDPRLDSLRRETRFIRLIQAMGLSS